MQATPAPRSTTLNYYPKPYSPKVERNKGKLENAVRGPKQIRREKMGDENE